MSILSRSICMALLAAGAWSAASADEIRLGAGAAPMENIFKKVQAPFEKATGIKLVLKTEGADQSFKSVTSGALDVASAGLAYKDWVELMKQKKIDIGNPMDYKNRVVGRDKIQVLANNSVSSVKALSKEQLHDIFTGKVSNWKAVGGPDQPIVIVFGSNISGTNKLWQEKIMGDGAWPASKVEVGDIIEVKKKVAATPGAVGIGPLAAEDDGSLHSPSSPEVGRPITALTKGVPSPQVQKLFEFISGEGQKYLSR